MKIDDRPGSLHRTKRDAEKAGRQLARAWHLEFVICNRDGVVRDRISYGGETSHLPATML